MVLKVPEKHVLDSLDPLYRHVEILFLIPATPTMGAS
jgi:hypothetical protein